jgi:large subunit ribosomal protein L2
MLRKLRIGLKNSGGRNLKGRITVYHRGGGHKRKYTFIDDVRALLGIPGKVISIEYDRNRTGYIALICYVNGICGYILAPEGLTIGSFVVSGDGFREVGFISELGSCKKLKHYLPGTNVYNVCDVVKNKAVYAKAAGVGMLVVQNGVINGRCLVRLPSREMKLVSGEFVATSGCVSNITWHNRVIRKAGTVRNLGRRPVVRGVAMNPIDHPHGGNTAGGRPSVSPWGRLTKGKPTRSIKKKSSLILINCRQNKRLLK